MRREVTRPEISAVYFAAGCRFGYGSRLSSCISVLLVAISQPNSDLTCSYIYIATTAICIAVMFPITGTVEGLFRVLSISCRTHEGHALPCCSLPGRCYLNVNARVYGDRGCGNRIWVFLA